MPIHYKIILPFTILFVAVTALTAWIAISLVSRSLDQRLAQQVDRVSEVVSRTGFALNRSIAEKLKVIFDAEIVTYTRDGDLLVSTLSPDRDAALLRMIRVPEVARVLFAGGQRLVLRDLEYRGTPYTVAYRPLDTPEPVLVAFAVPTSDIEQARRTATRTIAAIAAVMVAVMVAVSILIARSITSPVRRLVDVTRRLSAGDRTARADVAGRDEIGRLAAAFNDMADELRRSEEKLVRSEKLAVAGQLAAGVAHDIRNPLSSILMQAQMLRPRLVAGAGNQELLQAMLRDIDRVERVLAVLLDQVRPGELRREPRHVNEVLEDALGLTDAQLRHRQIEVERRLHPALPAVPLDAERLRQAFLNLIQNAADAMPTGGRLLAATRLGDDGATVEIEIADEGEGIDPSVVDRLFDPFVTTKRQGVGLGLANAKSVVERHGGRIALVPRAPRGARALVSLPVGGKDA